MARLGRLGLATPDQNIVLLWFSVNWIPGACSVQKGESNENKVKDNRWIEGGGKEGEREGGKEEGREKQNANKNTPYRSLTLNRCERSVCLP